MLRTFYNNNTIKVEKHYKYSHNEFHMNIKEDDGATDIDNQISNYIDSLVPTKFPTLFYIVLDFEDNFKEKEYYANLIVSLFCSYLIDTEQEINRERRLAVPKSIDKVNIGNMAKLKLVNSVLKFPKFSFEVVDRDGNKIIEVFE